MTCKGKYEVMRGHPLHEVIAHLKVPAGVPLTVYGGGNVIGMRVIFPFGSIS